jgi:AraC-like DNA-binding protein
MKIEKVEFNVKNELKPFVNCIMTGESASVKSHTNIPLYADGYPGIMFQQATNGFYLLPKKKKLSQLFLYGQTLEPISLDVEGTYQFIVLQLYPFASKYLLGVDPKELNDECFDLLEIKNIDVDSYKDKLLKSNNSKDQVEIILDLMTQLVKSNRVPENDRIQRAISIILKHSGQVKVKELTEQIFVTERTLERDFMSQVGLTPKQFAKIIQFQCSLNQLTQTRFNKLTEVGLDSGFADQSHFIRAFKKYTGQTPSYYLRQLPPTL